MTEMAIAATCFERGRRVWWLSNAEVREEEARANPCAEPT